MFLLFDRSGGHSDGGGRDGGGRLHGGDSCCGKHFLDMRAGGQQEGRREYPRSQVLGNAIACNSQAPAMPYGKHILFQHLGQFVVQEYK